jgi:hypothetical protein
MYVRFWNSRTNHRHFDRVSKKKVGFILACRKASVENLHLLTKGGKITFSTFFVVNQGVYNKLKIPVKYRWSL